MKAKRRKTKKTSSSEEDIDFCLKCLRLLPKKLTSANSIPSNTCKRVYHLKCANMRASFFTCRLCDSDSGDELQEEDDDAEDEFE